MGNVLVAGPPCAGKTTYVRDHAPAAATVVCFDAIARRIGWPSTMPRPPFPVARAAEREVQLLLDDVADSLITDAWVIRTMAGPTRRAELAARIHADVVLLVPPMAELVARARRRPSFDRTVRDINRWFERERLG
ncbi:hypothetical protein ACK8HX_02135 [Oryzobacter sp. R7]|uniref:hypothetical protein n=1 Tax=Oryzobacter faecalis TaxID=3388656 RepID=UPI00398CC9B9